jgi:hypothetical protein
MSEQAQVGIQRPRIHLNHPQPHIRHHLLVDALTSDDVRSTFLGLMDFMLEPDGWSVETENGFWWLPHRLRHTIDVIRCDDIRGDERWVCRSSVLLVEEIDDLASGLEMVHYFNQRSFGASVWLDSEAKEIWATSWVTLDLKFWFIVHCFMEDVRFNVGVLEKLAPRLAAKVDGQVPLITHPVHGTRDVPDRFVSEHDAALYGPEATMGLSWTDSEIEGFRHFMQIMYPDAIDAGQWADSELFPQGELSAKELAIEFDLDAGSIWALPEEVDASKAAIACSLGQTDHPDLGRGLEILFTTPLQLEDLSEPGGPPASTYDAMRFANYLNLTEAQSCRPAIGTSGWTSWRSQIYLSTFVRGDTAKEVQYWGSSTVGEAIGGILYCTVDRLATPSVGLEHPNAKASSWAEPITKALRGLRQNAGFHSLLADDRAVFATATQGCTTNELTHIRWADTDPDFDGLWALQHSMLLATFGIFNPLGPSVGSLEISIDYATGQALILQRRRHPFERAITIHAVIDNEGYMGPILGEFVERIVAGLEWGGLDWFEIVSNKLKLEEDMRRGLHSFGARKAENTNLRIEALALMSALPWERVSTSVEDQESRFGGLVDEHPGISDLDLWIEAVTNVSNIDLHNAFIRSPWESSEIYQRALDPAPAQERANVLSERVHERWQQSHE